MKLVAIHFGPAPSYTHNEYVVKVVVNFKVGNIKPFDIIYSCDGGGTNIYYIDAFMFCVLGAK